MTISSINHNSNNNIYIQRILSILKEKKTVILFRLKELIKELKGDSNGDANLQACLDDLVTSKKIFTSTNRKMNGQLVKVYHINPPKNCNASNVSEIVSNRNVGNTDDHNDKSSDCDFINLTNSSNDYGNDKEEPETVAMPQRQTEKPRYIIDPAFQCLFSKKTKEQYEELKEAIRTEGLRDPLVVWDEENTLLDGHNRDRICYELGIEPPICRLHFENRFDAKIWIIQNQITRRNLNTFQRVESALHLKPHYVAMGKENQRQAGGAVPKKSRKPVDTDEELAKIAKTSSNTVQRVEKIKAKATIEELNALRNDEDGFTIKSVFQKYYGKEKPVVPPSEPAKKPAIAPPTGAPPETPGSITNPVTRNDKQGTTSEPLKPILQDAPENDTPFVFDTPTPVATVETIEPSSPELGRKTNSIINYIRSTLSDWGKEPDDRRYILHRIKEYIKSITELAAEGDGENTTPSNK